MTEDEKIEIIKNAININDACVKIYGYCNSRTKKTILNLSEKYDIDISHYSRGAKLRKYEIVQKTCPICNSNFETKKNHKDEKTTCSIACSNYFFQHGRNNPDFDQKKYKERYEKISNKLRNKPQNDRHFFCKKCGTETTNFDYKKYCINCNIKKDKIIKEIISKIKEPKFCKVCNIDISNKPKKQIYCSNTCRGKEPVSDSTIEKIKNSMKIRIENGLHKGWSPRNVISYPEKFFMKVLENNNIKYKHNYTVYQKDLGLETNYYYYIDFYIEELNIGLEIDGKQHNYRIEHDEKRDTALKNNGYKIYRIKWKYINNQSGKEYIKSEIDNFLNYYHNELKKLN